MLSEVGYKEHGVHRWMVEDKLKYARELARGLNDLHTIDDARTAIAGKYPTVLKFDGLAAGKGVAVCPDEASAEEFQKEKGKINE